MRRVRAIVLSLLAFAYVFATPRVKAAASHPPVPAQGECVATASAGEAKFTGQISGAPNANSIEVTSGNQTAVVAYNDSTKVCQGGQPASVNALTHGAGVTAFGPMKRNGRVLEMTATKIMVAGPPPGIMRGQAANTGMTQGGPPPIHTNSNVTVSNASGGKTATDDWQAGAQGGSSSQNSAGSNGSNPMGSSARGNQNSPNSVRISCNALTFSVSTPRTASGGAAAGRASMSGVTCRTPVDQMALQLMQDALTNRRIASVTLTWQSQLEASLSDAEVSSVVFTSDNAAEVVEVTFSAEKTEIVHSPSGTKTSWNARE